MNVRAVVAMGLIAMSGVATAAPPGKGVEGPLGDELFYNYLDGYFGQTYFEDGRNERVNSDSAFGFDGSVFLMDPVYFLAKYRYADFSYIDGANRVERDWGKTSVGFGARLPISYATDLFATVTYEYLADEGDAQPVAGGVKIPFSDEYEGYGYELGIRGFVSGFAEIGVNYRYRQVLEDAAKGSREQLEERAAALNVVVPLYDQLSLFARVDYGVTYSNVAGTPDMESESFLLGARLNFRLPR